jgi:hypothetical protein
MSFGNRMTNVRLTSSVKVVLCGFVLTLLWTSAALSVAYGAMQIGTKVYPGTHFLVQDSAPSAISTSSDIDTTWRHTKHGWQDSNRWPVDTYVPRKTIELLHPFTWAAIVLISVVGTTIWATSEWEIARLFGEAADADCETGSDAESELQ